MRSPRVVSLIFEVGLRESEYFVEEHDDRINCVRKRYNHLPDSIKMDNNDSIKKYP